MSGRSRKPPVLDAQRRSLAERLAVTAEVCGEMSATLTAGAVDSPARYREIAEGFRGAAAMLDRLAARLDGSPAHLTVVPDQDGS